MAVEANSIYSRRLRRALPLVLAALFVLPALACFEAEAPALPEGEVVDMPAAVLYHFGKITADGAPLKTGDIAVGGAIIKTERKSLGNLQLQVSEARVVFLMREMAELKLSALRRDGVTDVTPILRRGRVLVQVKKLSGNERLFVYTPDAQVAVQGTELIIGADESGETQVEVHSGFVRVRPRIPELEELPPEVLARSAAAARIAEALDDLGVVVIPGEATRLSRARSEAAVALVPELQSELNTALAALRSGQAAGRSATELARDLDEKLDGPSRELSRRVAAPADVLEREGLAPIAPLQKTELPLNRREEIRREFKAVVSVSPEVVNDPERLAEAVAVDQAEDVPFEEVQSEAATPKAQPKRQATVKPAASEEEQLQSLANRMGGSVKVLVLQNGDEKRGVVVNQGEDYLFATTAGQQVYKREEVREVRLR